MNNGSTSPVNEDLATQDAIINARRLKTHCKLDLHFDFDTVQGEGMWLVPKSYPSKELHELNFTKVTDNFEKIELEFDYDDNLTNQHTQVNILSIVRKNGDDSPSGSHYDLNKIRHLRTLPQF